MRRLRIYIDTSVVGGFLDDEFAAESSALLDMAKRGEAMLVVSDALSDELAEAPANVRKVYNSFPEECLERLTIGAEAEQLQQKYIEAGVVNQNAQFDALHVAADTVARADMIVSWNFKHIVNFQRMRGYNAVNLREGYPTIEIHSPREVVGYEED